MGSSHYPEPIVNYAGLLNEKLVSGEPYAGEPYVRFGGRGDQQWKRPYPYHNFGSGSSGLGMSGIILRELVPSR